MSNAPSVPPCVRTALVVGGGIAGPVTAMALRRAGIEATVHEAYPTTAAGVGGTLAIAPNGLAALGVVGARETVEGIALPITETALAFGRREVVLPRLADLPPLQLVYRHELHTALHDRAAAEGIRFEYGKRLVSAEEKENRVVAHFADGSTATADVLIGADGVHSTVRTLIDPEAPGPDYTGTLSFEATVDRGVPTPPCSMRFTFGRQAYYLYWRLPDGRTHWGANLPQPEPMSLAEARAVPAEEWLARLREAYGEDSPAGDLVRSIEPGKLQINGSAQIMPKVPHWHRGRMALVGDAVHAPSNSSGQGASLAVESAVELARCLRDLPTPEAAFAAYEHHRRPRVERIAASAARINHAKAPGAVATALMPFLMRLMLATAMRPERSLGPVQRHRIPWDTPAEPAPR